MKFPKGLIVFLLGCVLYINTLQHEFVLDDGIVITENMFTQQGIEGWKGLLSYDTFYGFFKVEGKDQLVAGGRYRPLSPMLFALVNELFGNNPFVYHLINVLLYGFCCLLVFLFFKHVLERIKTGYGETIALLGALIFAAHPIHTEVVANIKGADEILSAIGALICLICSIQYQKRQKLKFLLFAAVAFFLSLLSKENTVTLIAILPLTLWMTGVGLPSSRILKPTISLIAVFIVYFILRSSILGWSSLTATPVELMNNPFLKYEGPTLVSLSFSEKMGTVFYSLGQYVKLLVFPHPLSHDYYPRQIPVVSLTHWFALISVLIHLALGIWSVLMVKKRNLIAYGALFYLLAMSITSNIVFPVGTNMSERFLFFPSIGFCLIIGYLIGSFVKNKYLKWSVVLIILVAFSLKTISRNKVWKDNFTLFQTDVSHSPNSAKLRNAAAGSITTRYGSLPEGKEKNSIMEQAIQHLEVALSIHPQYKNAHLLKGNAHLYKNEFEEGIQSYQNALKIDPAYIEARNNLLIAYRAGGRFNGETKGDLDKALEYLLKANEINDKDKETIRLLGVTYGMRGGHKKAIEYFSKLVELEPDNAEYWKVLGTAYHSDGQIEQRNIALNKARELNPELFEQKNSN